MAKVTYPAGHENRTVNFGGAENLDRLSLIQKAMEADLTINFIYDGKIRVVEAHAMGTSTKDGGLLCRGYQVAGVASRPIPYWGLFSVSKMENLTIGRESSLAPRDGYVQSDKQLDTIIGEIAL